MTMTTMKRKRNPSSPERLKAEDDNSDDNDKGEESREQDCDDSTTMMRRNCKSWKSISTIIIMMAAVASIITIILHDWGKLCRHVCPVHCPVHTQPNQAAGDTTTWITFTSKVFFNMPEVKEALHVMNKDHIWHGCQVGSGQHRLALHKQQQLYMNQDCPISIVPYIEDLLNAHIPMLVYNGDCDMMTNMMGTKLCLNNMKAWHGHDKWLDVPHSLWNVNNYPRGWTKEYNCLTYVVVYNSSHMVRTASNNDYNDNYDAYN